MRVTNNMMVNSMLWNVNRNLQTMSRKQDELSTGKKILRASDDPVATSKILKYKTDINEIDQFDRNSRDALAWLEASESAIIGMNSIMQRMRELTVQAATGTNTVSETQKIAKEVDELRKELVVTANATMAGRYLFSSYDTDEKLLNPDGTFNIDVMNHELNNRPVTTYQIGVGETIDIGINGLDLFGYTHIDNILSNFFPVKGTSNIYNYTRSALEGNVDLTADYTTGGAGGNGIYTVQVDGEDFEVDLSTFNGTGTPIDPATLTTAFQNGVSTTNPGKKLGDVTDVAIGAGGDISIESKLHGTVVMGLAANPEIALGSVTNNYSETYDKAATHSALTGDFDLTENYSDCGPNGDGIMEIVIDGATYKVDLAGFDGTETPIRKEDVVAAFKDGVLSTDSTQKMSDVTKVFFNSEGKLSIESKEYGNINMSGFNTADSDIVMRFKKGVDTIPATKGYMEGMFNVNANYAGVGPNGDGKVGITVGSTTYTVDLSSLNGTTTPITTVAVENAFKSAVADDGSGNTLDSAAAISFDGSTLKIALNTEGSIDMNHSDNAGFGLAFTKGRDEKVGTESELRGAFDLTADYSDAPDNGAMEITVGGTAYTATLPGAPPYTEAVIINAFETADDGSGNTLGGAGGVATVAFDNGELVITNKTIGPVAMKGPTDVNLFQPTLSAGEDAVGVKVMGTGDLSAVDFTTVTDTQTFVVNLDGVTKKIDIDFSGINSLSDMTTEVQNQLDQAYPPAGQIQVGLDFGNVLTFEVAGKNNGSTRNFGVDVIKSEKPELLTDIDDFLAALEIDDKDAIDKFLGKVDVHLDRIITTQSDIGARTNRLELVNQRLAENTISNTRLLSDAQDADMAETIMYLKNAENVYRASLQTGAKVIQPSLLDFLR